MGGPPVTGCTPTGTGNGVDSFTAGKAGTTVVNGTVQGLGRSGLSLGPRARIKEVRAVSNGFRGIETGVEASITGSTAINNGDGGIVTFSSSVVTGNLGEGARQLGPDRRKQGGGSREMQGD